MKPILATLAAIGFVVSPAIIENHIVPYLMEQIESFTK